MVPYCKAAATKFLARARFFCCSYCTVLSLVFGILIYQIRSLTQNQAGSFVFFAGPQYKTQFGGRQDEPNLSKVKAEEPEPVPYAIDMDKLFANFLTSKNKGSKNYFGFDGFNG